MAMLFANDAASTLQASINTSVTTISIAGPDAGLFPAPSGGDHFMVTVVDSAGNMEIMRCTARSGGTLTVVRAQEGTTAFAFAAGAAVDLRLTKGTMEGFSQVGHGHTAAQSTFDNTGTAITATTVQAALSELDSDLTAGLAALDADITAAEAAILLRALLTANTFTGDQTISKVNPAHWLRKTASGQSAFLAGTVGANERWRLVLGNDFAESGANAGSNFAIARFNDAGAYLGDALQIRRSDGFLLHLGGGEIGTPNSDHFLRLRKFRDSATIGGMLQFELQASSGLSGNNVSLRQAGSGMQMLEDGGTNRGIFWDLAGMAAGAASIGIHSSNLGAQIGAIGTGGVGRGALMRNVGQARNPGETTSGANLRYASTINTVGGGVAGIWQCDGFNNINETTYYCRTS